MAKTPVVTTAITRGSSFDPKPFFASFGDPSSISRFRKDQIIFSQGNPVGAVSYIESGIVKVTTHSKHGKKAVVAILGTGDFFGEEGLAGHPRRTATIAAMTDCSISLLEVPAFVHALREKPRFSELFIRYLATRKLQIEADLADQLLHSIEKRLARRLLLLTEPGAEGRPKPTTARVNQDTLAAMVGTTQSRVSFFMNKFRRLHLIDYNGELRIHGPLLTAFLND